MTLYDIDGRLLGRGDKSKPSDKIDVSLRGNLRLSKFSRAFMTEIKEVEEQEQLLYSSEELTNIEKWYTDIKQHTFETRFIPLTVDEAKAIQFCYEYYSAFKRYEIETNGEQKGIGVHLHYNDEEYKDKFGESFDWKMALNSNINNEKDGDEYKTHLKHLNNICNKIDTVMHDMKCDDGIFVKLSRRSPKDAANESIKMFSILKHDLSQKCENNFKNITNAQIIESYYYASMKSLCVYSGDEAIQLCARSYRIWKDLNLSILKQTNFNISIIVRKWNKRINPSWEFRLFLRNQKPTALTQYNPSIFSSRMYLLKQQIEDAILLKYNDTKASLSHDLQYFTMDFAIMLPVTDGIEEIKDNDIVIIEINPGPPVAGTALFIWENKTDQCILSGDKPFETRIHKSEDDIESLNDLEAILPDSVIYYVELLKWNKPNKTKNTEQNINVFDEQQDMDSSVHDEDRINKFCILL